MYYMLDSEDALTLKFLVAAIWIFDTLHVLFMCHILYHYLVKRTFLHLATILVNHPRQPITAFQ